MCPRHTQTHAKNQSLWVYKYLIVFLCQYTTMCIKNDVYALNVLFINCIYFIKCLGTSVTI